MISNPELSVDGGGIVTALNSEAEILLGYSADEVIGQPADRFFIVYRASGSSGPVQGTPGTGRCRLLWKRKDGKTLPTEAMLNRLPGDETASVFTISSTPGPAPSPESGIDDFVHSMKTPLGSIITMSQFLLRNGSLDEDAREMIAAILSEGERLDELVGMLRNGRQIVSRKQPLDISKVLDRVLEMRTCHLKREKISVVREYGPLAPVMADDRQMEEVFLNLVVNSEQAITERGGPGKIRMAAGLSKGNVRVTVSDDGLGIPDRIRQSVFEKYFTTKQAGDTHGLGLFISRKIVLDHGGSMTVDGALDKGATFVVELPVCNSLQSS